MENNLVPKWMVQIIGCLLIIFLVTLIIDKLKQTPAIMQVSAQSLVKVVPDVAIINLGVTTEGIDQVTVKNANNTKMNAIIKYLLEEKVARSNITTSSFYISPKYNYNNGQNQMVGFSASQIVTVKLQNINVSKNQLQTILDGVVNNGANEIRGVQFDFSDKTQYVNEARRLAIQEAKNKARVLTQESGLKLGALINIIDQSGDNTNFGSPMFASLAKGDAASVKPDIEPGKQDISANVTLVYEVKP